MMSAGSVTRLASVRVSPAITTGFSAKPQRVVMSGSQRKRVGTYLRDPIRPITCTQNLRFVTHMFIL
eukprot:1212523-Pyramimonas_sp.AAC.1